MREPRSASGRAKWISEGIPKSAKKHIGEWMSTTKGGGQSTRLAPSFGETPFLDWMYTVGGEDYCSVIG